MGVLIALAVFVIPDAHAQIPREALTYRATLEREIVIQWPDGPEIALYAAQIHQESTWNPSAASRFASGLSQFTPSTARWMGSIDASLHPAEPLEPAWALRAIVVYNRWLYARVRNDPPVCDRLAFTLSAYNGGLAWTRRDRNLARLAGADPNRWFGHVEHYTTRSAWAQKENRHYVRRILRELHPRYVAGGWPSDLSC